MEKVPYISELSYEVVVEQQVVDGYANVGYTH